MSAFGQAVFGSATFGAAATTDPGVTSSIVELDHIWFNDAADPSDYLSLPILTDSVRTWTRPGEVREYANGRRRPVSRPGLGRTWTPRLGVMTLEEAADLQSRAGRIQWVRDPLGGKVAAVFYEVPESLLGVLTSWRNGRKQHVRVSLTLTEVTHSAFPTT